MQSSSSKSTINLINNVRKRPFLYDQDSPNYRDVETRTQAWDEIGKELKIGAGEARLAWDKLRRCFSNALNRRRQQTSRARKSWRYHKYMEFLEPHVDCKKLPPPAVEDFLEVNIQEESVGEEADESSPTDVLSIKQEPVDAEEILSSLVDVDEEQVSEAEKEPLRVQYPKNFKTSNFGPPKRRKTRGFDYVDVKESDLNALNSGDITMQQPHSTFSPWQMDDTDMFFLSMARMTKSLSGLKQAQIKSRLSNDVLQSVIEREEQQRTEPMNSCVIYPRFHTTGVLKKL